MTTAPWKNFYVSEYDQEMHTQAPDELGKKRNRTEIDFAIEALERARETLLELKDTSDPHAVKAIIDSAQGKVKDLQAAVNRLSSSSKQVPIK